MLLKWKKKRFAALFISERNKYIIAKRGMLHAAAEVDNNHWMLKSVEEKAKV